MWSLRMAKITVMLCSLVECCQHRAGTWCILLQVRRWRQNMHRKRCNKLYIKSQKAVLFMVTAVKISNLGKLFIPLETVFQHLEFVSYQMIVFTLSITPTSVQTHFKYSVHFLNNSWQLSQYGDGLNSISDRAIRYDVQCVTIETCHPLSVHRTV